MEYYAIGDVHGEYKTLIKLVDQLPENSQLFFVGDLIDRGPDSSKVVDFVRKGNHQCVLGNHEDMMIQEARQMKSLKENYTIDELWSINGGVPTLLSYGIIAKDDDGRMFYTQDKSNMKKFIDDARWMESLPLYVEALKRKDGVPVIVTHAALGTSWPGLKNMHKSHERYSIAKEHITWNRNQEGIPLTFEAVNVFGHTPNDGRMKDLYTDKLLGTRTLQGGSMYVNIDTGCAYDKAGLGVLTALKLNNVEKYKTVTQERV